MRPDLLIQRIRDKSGHPTFPDPTDRCLPWTGASSHKGLTRRKLRDAEGSPYHAFVSARRFARILGSYVHLVVRKLLDPGPELRLYDARGTAATRLLEAGADLKEIAVHMGWSIKHAADVIERYVALSPQMADGIAV